MSRIRCLIKANVHVCGHSQIHRSTRRSYMLISCVGVLACISLCCRRACLVISQNVQGCVATVSAHSTACSAGNHDSIAVDTKALQKRVKLATSLSEILQVIESFGSHFDEIHTSSVLYSIAKLYRRDPTMKERLEDLPALQDMVDLAEQQVGMMDAFSLANTAWSLAQIQSIVPNAQKVVRQIMDCAVQKISTFSAVDLENIVFSAALLNEPHAELMSRVSGIFKRSADSMDTGTHDLKHMSKIVLSFVRLNLTDVPLMQSVSARFCKTPPTGQVSVLGLKDFHIRWSEVLLASAKMGVFDQQLFQTWANVMSAPGLLSRSDDWGIAAMLWVYERAYPAFKHKDLQDGLIAEGRKRHIQKSDVQSELLLDWVAWTKEFKSRRG